MSAPSAVTTPSALNSGITLPSVTEFKAAVWQIGGKLLLEKRRLHCPVTGTGVMRGNAYQAKKQQLFDTDSKREDRKEE